MLNRFIHQWLRVPYTLNVHYIQQPKRPRGTVLFLHGIGNSGKAWEKVIEKLPDDLRILSIDLLGFGGSARPSWAQYSAKTQARSVLATYLKLGVPTPTIIVGHSLGSLVAIEVAKRYRPLVKELVLCSPPLYRVADSQALFSTDELLRRMYTAAVDRPDQFLKLSTLAMKYNLVNESFNVTEANVASYMATLRTMIINQTSLLDAQKLTVPTTIIRGTLDPFIVAGNIQQLKKLNPNIHVKSVLAGHEVRGNFIKAVVAQIQASTKASSR